MAHLLKHELGSFGPRPSVQFCIGDCFRSKARSDIPIPQRCSSTLGLLLRGLFFLRFRDAHKRRYSHGIQLSHSLVVKLAIVYKQLLMTIRNRK
jgi:hypothetical protein